MEPSHTVRPTNPNFYMDDSRLVELTKLQAQKCAAIVSAFVDGHTEWGPAASTASAFLFAISLESVGGESIIKPSSEHYWKELDSMPWPT